MAVRSAALAKYLSSGAGSATLATVPAGETWLIKDVRIRNVGAGPVNVLLAATCVSPAISVYLFGPTSVSADGLLTWEGWVVMEPTDYLFFYASDAGPNVWVSGTALAGVAT